MSDEKKPADKAEVFKGPELKEPPPPPPAPAGKMHVDTFLHGTGVQPWEKGGRRAYAIAKGKEVATEAEFIELFKKY